MQSEGRIPIPRTSYPTDKKTEWNRQMPNGLNAHFVKTEASLAGEIRNAQLWSWEPLRQDGWFQLQGQTLGMWKTGSPPERQWEATGLLTLTQLRKKDRGDLREVSFRMGSSIPSKLISSAQQTCLVRIRPAGFRFSKPKWTFLPC